MSHNGLPFLYGQYDKAGSPLGRYPHDRLRNLSKLNGEFYFR